MSVEFTDWTPGHEVSCRVVQGTIRSLERAGCSRSELQRGLPDFATFKAHERTSWDVWCRLMENARTVLSDSDFIEIGASWFRQPVMRGITFPLRFFYDAPRLYEWLIGKFGGSSAPFLCTEPALERHGERVLLTITMKPGYTFNEELFLINLGGFREMPKLLGLEAAQVVRHAVPGGSQYEIQCPTARPTLERLRGIVRLPFAAVAAAREIDTFHDINQKQYHELRKANTELAQQTIQLRTAYEISRVVHAELDLQSTMSAVVGALVSVAGFRAAKLRLEVKNDNVDLTTQVGTEPHDADPIHRALINRNVSIGVLTLWPADSRGRSKELLDVLVPTISMALGDALKHASVLKYRDNLEEMVASRTRELADAQDELQSTIIELKRAQATRDKIFANVNHELRTPLSNIALMIESLRSKFAEMGDVPAFKRSLDGIDYNVSQLLELMDGLLLLAAGQAGKLELRRQEVNVGVLLRRVVDNWQPAAKQSKLTLAVNAPPSLHARIDPHALTRILNNLVSNALKYTPDRGAVRVSLTDRGDEFVVRVSDTGVGLSTDLQNRLFGRFEQGPDPVRPSPRGAGVGLAIVKELAEAHDGAVIVDSAIDKGATFEVTLPLERANADSCEALPDLTSSSAQYLPTPAPIVLDAKRAADATILIAEDDGHLRGAIAEILSDDFRVIAAADGKQALRLADEFHPELLITDINMPQMDGIELAKRFREASGQRMAPVIFLTAFGEESTRAAGFEAGGVDYLVKPFRPSDLISRVKAQLRQQKSAMTMSDQERLASLALLSGGLAHEFRNPANGILNAAQLLESLLTSDGADSAVAELLDVISSSAEQLRVLCKQLLGFAAHGDLELRPQPVEALLDRAATLCGMTLNGVDLRTQADYRGEVLCAGPFVVQMLVTLVENGAHAAGAGGWVEITSDADEENIRIRVRDSGTGVPDNIRTKIFEPFFTTKEPGVGTGLGLPVARRIMQQHGGQLHLIHVEGGTAFEASFPRSRTAAE